MKCIEDEIPFELPDGWTWVRINTACIVNPRNNIDDNTEVSFVPMANISEGYANSFVSDSRLWRNVKTGYTHFAENDIGIAKITPCFENKKSVVFTGLINGYGAGTTELHIIRTISGLIVPEYLLCFAKRNDFILGGVQTFSGDVGQQRVTKDYIANYLVSLPPLNEQKRIISAIKEAYYIIENIEKTKLSLIEDVKKAKSKILDLAIRGKLVPQDPNDEPASVLLERIREEKEELIKQGKIKRDKKESVIFKGDDNSYYQDLPNCWSVCKLCEISYFERGITFPASAKETVPTDRNIACARTANVQDLFDISNLIYVDRSFMKDNPDKLLKVNDIIVSTANSLELVGKSCIVEKLLEKMTFGGFVTVVRGIGINHKYIHMCLKNKFLKGEFSYKSTQTTNIANISTKDLAETIIYLPPLAEQERIVNAVETLFAQIDKIAEQIS